jgi:23S rRNA pseudouridine1911/1915/1917 synthase
MSRNNKTRLHKLVFEIINTFNLDYTRAIMASNIEKFGVYVDGVLIKNRLEWINTDFKSDIKIDHWPKNISKNIEEIKIIKESENFIVIFKPVDLVVQSGAGHKHDNLIEFLKNNYSQITNNFDTNTYPNYGLVHRLDKSTQGLLLIAKSPKAFDFYQDQFRNRIVQKKYLAVVKGFIDEHFECYNYQTKDKFNPLRQKLFWDETLARKYSDNYRDALSIFRPIASDNINTLVEIEIKTGRMHQIRLQCEQIGHPILNDSVYNQTAKKRSFENSKRIDIKKFNSLDFDQLVDDIFLNKSHYLMSYYLKFIDLDNSNIEVSLVNIDQLVKN